MKKFVKLFAIVLALLLFVNATTTTKAEPTRLVDNAEILYENEYNVVLNKLNEVSEKHNMDVVIVTTPETYGKTLQQFADDFYDFNDYGMGADKSGVLMLVDMDSRTIWFSTKGKAIEAFTDYGIYYLEDTVIDTIIDKGYSAGLLKFATEADRYIKAWENGTPIDVEPEPEKPFVPNPIISVIVGAFASMISALSAKGKNKSVAKKTTASDYKRAGSYRLTDKGDIFLYRNVSRVKIERDDAPRHGGSTTHVSSSGSTHGGGGGRRSF